MVRFLVIRFSSIGDIVLTTPVFRHIKTQIEDAEVHFLTKKSFLPVVENNPYIDKLHLFDDNYGEIISSLKKSRIDYIIDLHHNLRTSRVKSSLKRVSFSFNKLNIEKWFMVNLKINKLPSIHIVDRYLKTLDLFDIKNDGKGLDFFIHSNNEIDIKQFPELFHTGYQVLVIGAKHTTKQLPDEKIVALIKKLKSPVILLGGKEDAERGRQIQDQSGESCLNLCGTLSLQQSASVIRQSQLVITHDTGLMHIASAYHKIVLSIWGNTIPEFGMTPYKPGEGSEIFEVKALSCRPCSKIGYKKCPKGHFNCMNQINIEMIAAKANQLNEY